MKIIIALLWKLIITHINFEQSEDWSSSSSSGSGAKALILLRSFLTGRGTVISTVFYWGASLFHLSVVQLFHPLRILRHSFGALSTTGVAQALSIRAVDLLLGFQCFTNMNAQMQRGKS